jgi:hypothetical protein
MNTRLRNSLSALVVATSLVSLGYALGEPPRPGALVADLGEDAVVAMTRRADADATDSRRTPRGTHAAIAMPFFSFGQRASAGVR